MGVNMGTLAANGDFPTQLIRGTPTNNSANVGGYTTTGSGAAPNWNRWRNNIMVTGTFGGGTFSMLASDDGVNYGPIAGLASLTAPGNLWFQSNAKYLKGNLAGATSPSVTAVAT